MKLTKKWMAAAMLLAFAWACTDNLTPVPDPEKPDELELSFGYSSPVESEVWTKARQAVEVNSGTIVGAAVAIYDSNGTLVFQDKVSGAFTGFTKTARLNKERAYSCYMVTGYIAGKIAFPDSESALEGLEIENDSMNGSGQYDLTATLRDFGPDRAGSLPRMKPSMLDLADGASDGKVTVPLQSLWAKVEVEFDPSSLSYVDVSLSGDGVQKCGARYGSRVFRPFAPGGSISLEKMAMLPMEKRTAEGGEPTGSFCFYVPENMFGNLLPANASSDKKTPSEVEKEHGATVRQAVEQCSVELESTANADWGDQGLLTYRFCLGMNETSNFDIRRNTAYHVILTATAEGFAIKEWKASLELPDSRVLRLNAPERSEKTEGMGILPCFIDSDIAEADFNSGLYLIPDYFAMAQDFTRSTYGQTPGWDLTPQTKAMLSSYGIQWELVKRYVYVDNSHNRVFYSEEKPGNSFPFADAYVYYDKRELPSDVLKLYSTDDIDTGTSIPITIQTHDGQHSATVTAQVVADGSVTIAWDKKAEFIAHQGKIKTTRKTGSVKSVRFSVKDEYSSIIEVVDAGNGTCTVKAKRAGDAAIEYTGINANGAQVCHGIFPFTVEAPVLHSGTSAVELSLDGTAVSLEPYYTDRYGNRLSFNSALYEELLAPGLAATESAAAAFLGCSGTSAFIAELTRGGASVSTVVGRSFADALEVRPKAAPDVNSAYCDVYVKPPLGRDPDALLGTIDNQMITGFKISHSGGIAVSGGVTATLPNLNLDLGASAGSISIQGTADLSFALTPSGAITVTGATNPTGFTAGRIPLNVSCSNSRCGGSVTIACGYLDVYLHTAPVAMINLDTFFPEVSADIAGKEQIDAFADLYTKLTKGYQAVRCNFGNGSFYSLGNGRWNHIDEFDDAGNQYTAPQQGGLMTEFIEKNWPSEYHFGEVAYTIHPGDLESDAGKYDSMEQFLSFNEHASLYFDFSRQSFLRQSPFVTSMYHFDFGSQTDSYGYSYYIIDLVSYPKWKL